LPRPKSGQNFCDINKRMTNLLRVSLDIGDKDPTNHPRFKNTVESIKSFSKLNNKLVVIAHYKRPGGKYIANLSLKRFVPYLEKSLGKKIIFLDNPRSAGDAIASSKNGSVFLLENIRFFKGETGNDKTFIKLLSSLGDKYINDDFPDAHRAHASTYGLAKVMSSQMGPHLKEELFRLTHAIHSPRQPAILILGGAKADEKISIVNKLLGKVNHVLLGGVVANNLLRARGVNIGKSVYDKKAISFAKKLANKEKVVTPLDWTVNKNSVVDIGPYTIAEYKRIISNAKTIIWNGPLGRTENPLFAKGTQKIARAIFINKKAHVLIGGGDTLASISPPKNAKNVFISTGGGAMLTFLAGKKLPAVEALNKIKR